MPADEVGPSGCSHDARLRHEIVKATVFFVLDNADNLARLEMIRQNNKDFFDAKAS